MESFFKYSEWRERFCASQLQHMNAMGQRKRPPMHIMTMPVTCHGQAHHVTTSQAASPAKLHLACFLPLA
jgi:hypothetical protein